MEEIKDIIKITQGLNLLYVEDNKNSMKSSILFFEEFFNNIITAVDGLDGLQKFQENDIDLIITDLNMPKLNGLKMIEQIKEIDDSVSIIILTAYNETIFFLESIKLGVEAYLLKPIDLDKFLTAISKVAKIIHIKKGNKKCIKIMKKYHNAIKELKQLAENNPEQAIEYINKYL